MIGVAAGTGGERKEIKMTFRERLTYYIESQGEDFPSVLAGSGFSFDLSFGGERIGFRRKSDQYTDPDKGTVRTVFLVFPQNGDKKRLLMGCELILEGNADAGEGRVSFKDTAVSGYRTPSKGDVYHAQAAVRASKSFASVFNTYLHHSLYVHTPEKEVFPMEEFDFEAHPLFMLGLLGNEYTISAVRMV